MKVLVVGGGGREHALVWKIAQSPRVSKVYAAPGNAGMEDIAEVVDISDENVEKLLEFAKNEKIDLTVVGPEASLVRGIVDTFEAEGLRIFGPNMNNARLEGSKAAAKAFMVKHGIPTAKYGEYDNLDMAKRDVGMFEYPVVIKADGLAAGKGVIIAPNEFEATKALDMIMFDKKFGSAGEKVIIEEFLDGIEASILCFVDGQTILPMASAQDYKKALDGDLGLNTGGMGTYSPSRIYNDKIASVAYETVIKPFLNGVKQENMNYKGVIFIGAMIKDDKVKVLEFNVRFGDPETQVILPRMENDIIDVFEAVIDGKLKDIELKWSDKRSVCVVLASGGYPENYEKGKVISGLENLKDEIVFHAGTKMQDGKIVTNGGRVLGVVALERNIDEARKLVYGNIGKISFEGMEYRTDIGK